MPRYDRIMMSVDDVLDPIAIAKSYGCSVRLCFSVKDDDAERMHSQISTMIRHVEPEPYFTSTF